MKVPPSILLPQGVRDILPEEAEQVAAVEGAVLSVFEKNGYKRVVTPLLEYVDVLIPGLGEELQGKVMKLVEPTSGKVMAIRPDITPQIARLVSTRMRDAVLPLKLCYNESVLRFQVRGEAGSREVIQAGAEYVSSKATPEIDAEMVVMAIESLKNAGVEDFKVDLADVGFIKELLKRLSTDEKEDEKIMEAIALKDESGLKAVLKGLEGKFEANDGELLLALTTLYGEDEVIERAERLAGSVAPLKNLKKVVEIVKDKGYGEFITIDLGEVRGFDYYTGIIFEAFCEGFGKPLLGGGRYDSLLGKYGFEGRSIGFAIDVESVVAVLDSDR